MPRDWDAPTYDRIADPQARWGRKILDRLPLAGDESVLDAGCGSGRVTEALLARVPRGRVVGLDGSPRMIAEARRRLGTRVAFVVADLRAPLPFAAAFDAVFSTATFHWIPDHDALFRELAAVLRPGGRLVAQCGGAGNAASVRAALDAVGEPWDPWSFATPEATRQRLESAGFVEVEAWLAPEPTTFASRQALETFLATVVLGAHLERRPAAERAGFVRAVAAALPALAVDYVRLNFVARRAPGAPPRPGT
ncbi:MAG TPA: methyltransferase domain-containing protein [Candidatus Binatia bacterium]|nr:methyltransferase domain-containing protein [Candidatus Binatia bacterium]